MTDQTGDGAGGDDVGTADDEAVQHAAAQQEAAQHAAGQHEQPAGRGSESGDHAGHNRGVRSTQRFEAAYRAHYWAICRYVARRLGSTDEAARDLTAEVFVVAWKRRGAMPVDPLPWLYVVARNVVANELRGRHRRERLEHRLAVEHRTREADHDARPPTSTEAAWVRSALERLSPADQEVLRLAAWEELGADHLADALAVSRSAAAMRLHRARERLREVLHGDPSLSQTLRRSR